MKAYDFLGNECDICSVSVKQVTRSFFGSVCIFYVCVAKECNPLSPRDVILYVSLRKDDANAYCYVFEVLLGKSGSNSDGEKY